MALPYLLHLPAHLTPPIQKSVLQFSRCGVSTIGSCRSSVLGMQPSRLYGDPYMLSANGDPYFNRSGPRLVESLEILAEILHPDHFAPKHQGAVFQPSWARNRFSSSFRFALYTRRSVRSRLPVRIKPSQSSRRDRSPLWAARNSTIP